MKYISPTQLMDILDSFSKKIKELKVDKQEATLTLNNATVTNTGSALTVTGSGLDFAVANTIIKAFPYSIARSIFEI